MDSLGLPSTRFPETTPKEVYESWLREHFRERHLDVSDRPEVGDPADWEPTFDAAGRIVGERNAREYAIARQKAEGRLKGHDYSRLNNEQLIDVDHYIFFPNFVILAKADDSFILRSRPHAKDPDRCLFDIMRLLPVDQRQPAPVASQQWIEANEETLPDELGEVIAQDLINIQRVQRGLHANALEHVTLTANEIRVRWLNDDIDRYLEAGV